MDVSDRASPLWLAMWALVFIAAVAGMVRLVIEGWAVRTEDFSEMLWLLPGSVLIGGSIVWAIGVILVRQTLARTPHRRNDRVVVTATRSMRRSSTVGLLGLASLGAATIGILAYWLATGEISMNRTRWLLLAALIAVFIGLGIILVLVWRLFRVRFVADQTGLSWDRFIGKGRIELPWTAVKRTELRGRWLLTTRWVVIDRDGHAMLPLAFDPTIPMSRTGASKLAEEIDSLRPDGASLTEARREGVEPPTF